MASREPPELPPLVTELRDLIDSDKGVRDVGGSRFDLLRGRLSPLSVRENGTEGAARKLLAGGIGHVIDECPIFDEDWQEALRWHFALQGDATFQTSSQRKKRAAEILGWTVTKYWKERETRWSRCSEALLLLADHLPDQSSQQGFPEPVGDDGTPNPYKGLSQFREEDAGRFFGRAQVSSRLVGKLEDTPLVAVIGASGSGKSSVVAAGAIPEMRRTLVERSLDVTPVQFRPGARPLYALAVALNEAFPTTDLGALAEELDGDRAYLYVARLVAEARGRRLLIIVDQFEEIFTQCREPAARERLIELLVEIATASAVDEATPRVVLVLRSDFYARVLDSRRLADALQDNIVHLPPMNEQELTEAIAGPLSKSAWNFEEGLVERLVVDAAGEPGCLPLVQYCLSLLWRARTGDRLTVTTYEALGGLNGAIAGQAETVFLGLSNDAAQLAARRLISRLIRVADGHDGDTRRRVAIGDLAADEVQRRVLDAFVRARLLTTDYDRAMETEVVELAHEAVISNWDRLRGWLVEDREFLLWQQKAQAAASEWHAANRDAAGVLRGRSLEDGIRWLESKQGEMNPDVAEILDASINVRDLEATARALEQAEFLLSAQPMEIPRILGNLDGHLEGLLPQVIRLLHEAPESRQWRIRVLLVGAYGEHVDPLLDYLCICEPDELGILLEALQPYANELSERLWSKLGDATATPDELLRIGCSVAEFDPQNPAWNDLAASVAGVLVTVNPMILSAWIRPLSSVAAHLIPPTREELVDASRPPSVRDAAALVLLNLARDDARQLAQFACDSSLETYGLFVDAISDLATRSEAVVELEAIAGGTVSVPSPTSLVHRGSRRAVATITRARLHASRLEAPFFEDPEDPEAASQFVRQAPQRGIDAARVATALIRADSPLTKYWLALALGRYDRASLPGTLGAEVVSVLGDWYDADPSAGVHAAIAWLLTKWGELGSVERVDETYTRTAKRGPREWFNLRGPVSPLPFAVIPGGSFVMGCEPSERGAKGYETPRHEVSISNAFAMCTREVTRGEYERFLAETDTESLPDITWWSPTDDHPVVGIQWSEAEAFLEWLTGHVQALGAPAIRLRLPTEAEWEWACRARTTTSFSFGDDWRLLRDFGWYHINSDYQTHPTRILPPNQFGLFCMHGNTWEWCSDWHGPYGSAHETDPTGPAETPWRVLRGGCWNLDERYSRSACRNWHVPTNRNWYIGMRAVCDLA